MSFTKLDYCQYLLSSPINDTLTNLAEHLEGVSHDRVNRYLRQEKLTPRLLWENVKEQVQPCEDGFIVFDDTVLDKRYAHAIEMSRRQYSGCEQMPSATLRERVIRGIGIVSCLYVNADTGQFWVIDYRLYDPAGDGKTKLDHLIEMLNHLVETKQLPFGTVLMDSWYAAQKVMERIDHWGKVYYCPLKVNRLVDDTGGVEKYKRIDPLEWNAHEQQHGKLIKVRGFPKDKKVKLFRVIVSTDKTDYVVTNDLSQASTDVVQQVCDVRWTIEEFHRELKQLTGVEACQCNHIACALLVWVRLKTIAYQTHQTIYRVKHRMLSSYLIEQLNLHYSQGQYKGSHSLDLRTQWEKLGDKLGQKSVNRTENRSKHANSLQIDTPIL